MKFISKLFSTFLGIGFFPIAPGTLTSLIAVLAYKFGLYKWTWPYMLALFVLMFVLGVLTSSRYISGKAVNDPSEVVVDEVLGQWVALFMLEPSWWLMGAAFFLFRFFDIIKPFYIKRAENYPKGWGIMLDDIMAGVYTSVILHIVILLT